MLPQILGYLGATAAQAAGGAPGIREQMRTKTSAIDGSIGSAEALGDATIRRIKELGVDSPSARNVVLEQNVPADPMDVLSGQHQGKYAGYQRLKNIKTGERGSKIKINPNASRDLLAHELGHHITDQTKAGKLIMDLRANPKLAKALAISAVGAPIIQASLQEGDDDLVEGMAISALMSSPTLINEALATKNGLAILADAGMPANLGQRGRLAGAYLSYAAAPILAGLGGNIIGNIADDYTGIYDL